MSKKNIQSKNRVQFLKSKIDITPKTNHNTQSTQNNTQISITTHTLDYQNTKQLLEFSRSALNKKQYSKAIKYLTKGPQSTKIKQSSNYFLLNEDLWKIQNEFKRLLNIQQRVQLRTLKQYEFINSDNKKDKRCSQNNNIRFERFMDMLRFKQQQKKGIRQQSDKKIEQDQNTMHTTPQKKRLSQLQNVDSIQILKVLKFKRNLRQKLNSPRFQKKVIQKQRIKDQNNMSIQKCRGGSTKQIIVQQAELFSFYKTKNIKKKNHQQFSFGVQNTKNMIDILDQDQNLQNTLTQAQSQKYTSFFQNHQSQSKLNKQQKNFKFQYIPLNDINISISQNSHQQIPL